jgi:hypothetical protein
VKDGRHTLSYQPKLEAQTRSGRVYKHIAAVAQANPNINPYEVLHQDEEEDNTEVEVKETETFDNAWNHPDANNRSWREAIQKEFRDMNTRKVWRKMKKIEIPNDKRLIGNKWVFRKKKDGRYRARLCALGYWQKPGEDFMEISSSVVDDVTVRTVITNMLIQNWESEVLDVTMAFLYGDIDRIRTWSLSNISL